MSDELSAAGLLPCPFCGSAIVGALTASTKPGDRLGVVVCGVCGCEGPKLFDDAELVGRWNRRAEWAGDTPSDRAVLTGVMASYDNPGQPAAVREAAREMLESAAYLTAPDGPLTDDDFPARLAAEWEACGPSVPAADLTAAGRAVTAIQRAALARMRAMG